MTSMPQPGEDDQNSNHTEDIILGVDIHKDLHVAAVITSLGALRESTTFPATAAGYQALLSWASTFGVLRRASVECTGSYGAALARHLRSAGVEVIEVNQPDKATRRRQGKTDSRDAEAAARAVLADEPAAARRLVTGQWRYCGCSSWPSPPLSRPAPRRSTNSKPCWWRPIPRCAKHSLD